MFFKIFLIFFIIEGIVAQNCQLNATLMDRKWIYAVKPTPYTWDILHSDYIQDQATLYLICSNMSDGKEKFCNRGRFQDSNNNDCAKRIKAKVELVPNDNTCRRMGGELYKVQYTLPAGTKLTLYEVCYSTIYEQSLYTRHKSYGFDLDASTYRRPTFTSDNVVSRQRVLSFQAANIYNAFVRLLGPQQKYIPDNKTLILERGHLANSQDFISYDQMDETFKYVNVMPQFRGSNRSNWKRIENWIHNLPAKNTYAEVVTGSIGVLNLTHSTSLAQVPMYLMANNKNPIPLWTYKVVKYNNICYAFITLNNDFNELPNINLPICRTTTCPSNLIFNTSPGSGLSYCCNYNNFVRNVGRHAVLC